MTAERRHFVFRVFMLPGVPSQAACRTLRRLCEERLDEGGWEVEEVDLRDNPLLAVEHRILAVPTVVRLQPPPPVRVVGDLSDEDRAAQVLELPSRLSSATPR